MADEISTVTKDGVLHFGLHEGQGRAWDSEKRIVAVLAGAQGGKTCFGPLWLYREMQRRGPGDYLVVTPNYPLLQKKAGPEFKRLFERYLALGTYLSSDKLFRFSAAGAARLWGDPTGHEDARVLFGYAEDPDSLASATAKAAWLDEAGQKKFRVDSWEEVQRRVAIHEGRILITTTLYNLGWVVQQLWTPWRKAAQEEGGHPDIEVVRFESIQNPAFPRPEWERLKRSLPRWKFDLQMRAIPTRPAGVIYDAFDPERHVVPPFAIPAEWPRFLGIDFGGVNTAALFYARDPKSGRYYLYREYKAGRLTAKGHARRLREREPMPKEVRGGSRSEGQWRREFHAAGLPVKPPSVDEVEVGIDRVYGFHQREELFVFADCTGYLDEKETYSRKLDEKGEPTETIEDKETFHFMDAERYILAALAPSQRRRARRPSRSYVST